MVGDKSNMLQVVCMTTGVGAVAVNRAMDISSQTAMWKQELISWRSARAVVYCCHSGASDMNPPLPTPAET